MLWSRLVGGHHLRAVDRLGVDAIDARVGRPEDGNPTIVATLTIIVALLPKMFVSGLMGPYMSPIPANASMAMVFSFFVAVVITPWLLLRVAGRHFAAATAAPGGPAHAHDEAGVLGRLYLRIARPLLTGRRRATLALAVVAVATVAVCVLFATRDVTVKLLPFDNKSELQVVVDLPQSTTLEGTERFLMEAAERLKDLPELTSLQLYAGTSAPFNFNGLVRHYYLRAGPEQGDLQVNLKPKGERSRASHAIALDVRKRLESLPRPPGTALRVVEVPPGPPVLATLLAEIYGADDEARRAATVKVREAFSRGAVRGRHRRHPAPPGRPAALLDQPGEPGVLRRRGTGGVRHHRRHRRRRDGRLFPARARRQADRDRGRAAAQRGMAGRAHPVAPLPAGGTARQGRNVELGDVVTVTREPASYPLYRRDGRFAEMVQAEVAGRFEAPIYGMLAVEAEIAQLDWGKAGPPPIHYHGQPTDESTPALAVGRRMGGDLRHFPGHGSRLHAWRSSASTCWSSHSSAPTACRW